MIRFFAFAACLLFAARAAAGYATPEDALKALKDPDLADEPDRVGMDRVEVRERHHERRDHRPEGEQAEADQPRADEDEPPRRLPGRRSTEPAPGAPLDRCGGQDPGRLAHGWSVAPWEGLEGVRRGLPDGWGTVREAG